MSQPPPQESALAQVRDLLANLQDRTAQFDAQVAQMSKALDHWRLLGAEYEALADEVNGARKKFPGTSKETRQAQQDALVRIRRDFDGQVVDQDTVCDLFGARVGQTITRSIDHIASAIGRRLDYVNQNTQTLEKKVESVMSKLSALELGGLSALLNDNGDVADQEGKGEGEAEAEGGDSGDFGGPVTDIVEQLDDDDNVVDVKLHRPSDTQSHVLEALKKAGIEEIPAGGPSEAKKSVESTAAKEAEKQKETAKESAQAPKFKPNTTPKTQPAARKGVSFSDDTKSGDHAVSSSTSSASSSSSSQPQSFAAQRLENIMRSAKEQETIVDASTYIVPDDEAADDAALRREMLEYSRSEIGPIVAQLDIDEGLSDDDEGYNDEFYDDDDFDDDYDGEEDENGRSKYSVIDDAYRERMRELERKLGVAPLANPTTKPPGASSTAPTAATTDDVAESLGRIRVSGLNTASVSAPADAKADDLQESPKSAASLASALKEPTENFRTKAKATGSDAKKVSFAKFVDIAPESKPPTPVTSSAVKETAPAVPAGPVVDPLSDVVERGSSSSNNNSSSAVSVPVADAKPKRVSRFKKARGDASTPTASTMPNLPQGPHQAPVRFLDEDRTVAPEGPAGKTHADEVIERQAVTEPKEPHELDAGILMQEAATEYHRTRNRMIQQQGGFLKASETAVVPVGQEDGGPRISKFKAARLGNQFMSP
ncbi:hypothetical protein SCUCBS95973_006149 [Sporothrix curviconia]|uniref:DUF3835 domain-containing protein n=1 Tax=Sporothrix curviconia TaxID=1260050 RepID=A0ABP0C361_9PEZI